MFQNMGLHIIKNPAGLFSYVGSVPVRLGYTLIDGGNMSEELIKNISQFGPGLFRNKVRSRTFTTYTEAFEFARLCGYTVIID